MKYKIIGILLFVYLFISPVNAYSSETYFLIDIYIEQITQDLSDKFGVIKKQDDVIDRLYYGLLTSYVAEAANAHGDMSIGPYNFGSTYKLQFSSYVAKLP